MKREPGSNSLKAGSAIVPATYFFSLFEVEATIQYDCGVSYSSIWCHVIFLPKNWILKIAFWAQNTATYFNKK
jgi:hypothetical protein